MTPKTLIKTLAVTLALGLSTALAGEPSVAPKATSVATPVYNLELPESEIAKLIKEIENQGLVGSSEISINSLRHVGDKAAYDFTVDAIAKRMSWAIYELSEVKRNVIRYSVIVNQANLNKEKVMLITDTSSKISQGHYDRAIWSIAGAFQDEAEALKLCVSEVCVIEVADSFEAMTRFAEQIDHDLDFKKLNSDTRVFWTFDHPILKASFSKAFHAMIPNNQDHNAYKVLAAGVFTPLSVAGVTTIDLLKAAGSAVFNPRYSNIKLEVSEVKIKFSSMYDTQKDVFQKNYMPAADGTRARSYVPPVVIVPATTATNTSPAAQGLPAAIPGQDREFWLSRVKGATTEEKEPCARMAMSSAEEFDRKIADLKAKVDPLGATAGEIEKFYSSLSQQQLAQVVDYASNYGALAKAGRSSSDLYQLDAKLTGYVYNMLQANFDQATTRFAKHECDSDHPRYDVTEGVKGTPSSWNAKCQACNGYGCWGGPAKSASNVFINASAGTVGFWACAEQLYGTLGAYACSGVNLVTGERLGTSLDQALRSEGIKAVQGAPWFGQNKEEFVRSELPACF